VRRPRGKVSYRRGRPRCLGASLSPLLTGLTQRFVDQLGERLGCCGAFAPGFVRGEGGVGGVTGIVWAPDMDEEADEDKSGQEKLVQQGVWCHDAVPFHADERVQDPIFWFQNSPSAGRTRPPPMALRSS
jgi:hypothetical protein